jgi:hypothetical protein
MTEVVSEERTASIFRIVDMLNKQVRRKQQASVGLHGVTSRKIVFFIGIAVNTSNPA